MLRRFSSNILDQASLRAFLISPAGTKMLFSSVSVSEKKSFMQSMFFSASRKNGVPPESALSMALSGLEINSVVSSPLKCARTSSLRQRSLTNRTAAIFKGASRRSRDYTNDVIAPIRTRRRGRMPSPLPLPRFSFLRCCAFFSPDVVDVRHTIFPGRIFW